MLLACIAPISALVLPLSPAPRGAARTLTMCDEPGRVAKSSLPEPVQEVLDGLDLYDPTTMENDQRDQARRPRRAHPRGRPG